MSIKLKRLFKSFLVLTIVLSNRILIHAQPTTKTIQILSTSDLHNHFYPYQYMIDSTYEAGSLAKVATVVNQKRIEYPNTILIDNGDTIQDNSSSIFLDQDVFPMIAGLNALDYDVWVAGNHEFNYGMDVLQKAITTFNGQFLLSNVYKEDGDRLDSATNYTIITRDDVRTAVIGAVTPNITRWDKDNLEGYTVTDPKIEIENAVKKIRDNNEADIVIVSFHASLNGEYAGFTDSAKVIAEEVEGIDAIICGHEHALIDTVVNDVVIVEPSSFGQYVAQILFEVEEEDGGYKITGVTSDTIKTANYSSNPDLLTLLEPYHEYALADSRSVIGELVEGSLVPEADIPGIPQVQVSDTALIDLILKVQMDKVNASITIPNEARHVASTALFIEDSNVQPGEFRKSDVANIYKYDNTLMTVKITGAVLKEYLEWSARYFNTYSEGDLTISFDPSIRIYNYDMFGGIDYKINIAKEAGKRIEDLVYSDDKVSVEDHDVVYLTLNNYRANGALSEMIDGNLDTVYDSNNDTISTIREMIIEYISKVKTIAPEVDNNWEIIGTNWNTDKRAVVKQLVESGELSTSYSSDGRTPNVKPLTWEDVESVATVVSFASINDFHGAVSETSSNPGLAKLATAVNNFKNSNEHAYFLGSGDLYQGSAISNLTQGKVVNEVLKELGMLYSAVGNHEFDWGAESLTTFMEDGNFQFLCANAVYTDGTSPAWAQPTAMIEIGDVKVGIIGLTTPNTKYQTASENVADIEFLDPIETTIAYEKELRAQGADAVIVLSHLGSAPEGYTGYDLEGEALAQAVPTLDGIFTAHYHLTVDKVVSGVPVLQGYYNGRALARLTLVFDSDGKLIRNFGEVEDLRSQIATLEEDVTAKNIVTKYENSLESVLGEVLATTPNEYHHDVSISPVTDMGQLTAMMMADLGNTQIAIINGGGIRNGLTPGAITMGNMYEIFPFDNTLVTMEVTGEHLKSLLEHGIPPCDFKAGQYYGLTAYYDYDEEGNAKISKMFLLDGTEIEMDKTYTVAALDFMVTGGDKYDFTGAINVINTMIPVRDSLVGWMKAEKVIDFVPTQNLFLGNAPETKVPLTVSFNKEVTMVVDENTSEQDFVGALDYTANYLVEVVTDFEEQVDVTRNGTYEINVLFTKVDGEEAVEGIVTLTVQTEPVKSVVPNPSPTPTERITPTGDVTKIAHLYLLLGISVSGLYLHFNKKTNIYKNKVH